MPAAATARTTTMTATATGTTTVSATIATAAAPTAVAAPTPATATTGAATEAATALGKLVSLRRRRRLNADVGLAVVQPTIAGAASSKSVAHSIGARHR